MWGLSHCRSSLYRDVCVSAACRHGPGQVQTGPSFLSLPPGKCLRLIAGNELAKCPERYAATSKIEKPHCSVHPATAAQCKLVLCAGHRKAVSYVRFLAGSEVVSASTDSTLRMWDARALAPSRTFSGHTNEKNFVGLSVDQDFIACGSETNEARRRAMHGLFCKYLDTRCLAVKHACTVLVASMEAGTVSQLLEVKRCVQLVQQAAHC